MNLKKTILSSIATILVCCIFAQQNKPVSARVMTFNIRLENNWDGQNNWELRYQEVSNFIKKNKVDILGLQEVRHIQLTDLQHTLKGYQSIGVARDDGKQQGEYSPLFFNTNKFNLLSSGTFWLSKTPSEPSRGWDAAYNRIATWAILQDKERHKSLLVLNTHLDHVGVEARTNSIMLIKERLARMTNGIPIIVMGDLNVTETDDVCTKLKTNYFKMNDVWRSAEKIKGPAYTFHDFGKLAAEEREKIDFIFVTKQVRVKRATIFDSLIEGDSYLSDHNAHSADIVF